MIVLETVKVYIEVLEVRVKSQNQVEPRISMSEIFFLYRACEVYTSTCKICFTTTPQDTK